MWTAGITLFAIVGLGYSGMKALDPRTRLHKFFCTRCRRRAEYMS